jgi:hypothetical protein
MKEYQIGFIFGILAVLSVIFIMGFVAHAQETTLTASVPLWYEVSTSSDTVFIRTNGAVRVSNPENNYE